MASFRQQEGFHRATHRFKATISSNLSDEFAHVTLESLQQEIDMIQSNQGRTGSLRNMSRLRSFIEGMTQFGHVIDVFVNASEFVCFVWGPMKFLLGIAKTHVESFDKLLDVYDQIGDAIPSLLTYKTTFEQHEPLRVVLHDYYSDFLRFHEEAIKVFKRPRWKDLFHATWKTFDSQFGPIIQSLRSRKELLESHKLSASLSESRVILNKINDIQKEQAQRADDEAQESHRLRVMRLKDQLAAPDYFTDQEMASEHRQDIKSGEWIFNDATYKSWSNKAASGHSVLYINGIPGAGKTTLVSSVIERLLQTNSKKCTRSFSVAYFYFKHGQVNKNNHNSFLRAILAQLMDQDEAISQELADELSSKTEVTIRATNVLESLTARALEQFNLPFLILDGLDECANGKAETTIRWLLSLLDDGRYRGKSNLRLLFSGQRDGLLDRLLHPHPSISLDSLKHVTDVHNYCIKYCKRIRSHFGITGALEDEILSMVSEKAHGMFLYARVVLENLLHQPSRASLKREIKQDIFPADLNDAYGRVVTRVLETEFAALRTTAIRILALVITAKRHLKWREIQSFFCIDGYAGGIDPDELLRDSAKTICGSLVDTHQAKRKGEKSERVIQIVHHTAQSYLIQSSLVDKHLENARMASFCLGYLASPPFMTSEPIVIRTHARSGYYSLLDYAAQHWYTHANEAINRTKAPYEAEGMEVAKLSRRFLENYGMARDKKISDDDAEQCTLWVETLSCLPKGERDRAKLLRVEERMGMIRIELENLTDLSEDEKTILKDLNGPFSFKCHKPWCVRFDEGFSTLEEQLQHKNQHDRPFRCKNKDCFGFVLGFESEDAVASHNTQYHGPRDTEPRFPDANDFADPRSSDYEDEAGLSSSGVEDTAYRKSATGEKETVNPQFPSLWNSEESGTSQFLQDAAAGKLDAIWTGLISGENINQIRNPRSYKTPLWYAADGNHYELCKLLIQQGAHLGRPYSYSQTTNESAIYCTTPADTPLAAAAHEGHTNVVKLLLDAHAATNPLSDFDMNLAIFMSVHPESIDTLRLLMKTCEGRPQDLSTRMYRRSFMMEAQRVVNLVAVKELSEVWGIPT